MPTLRETIANRGTAPSPVRSAVRADLKLTRRRLYELTQTIDRLMGIDDDAELLARAVPLIKAVRRIPDA